MSSRADLVAMSVSPDPPSAGARSRAREPSPPIESAVAELVPSPVAASRERRMSFHLRWGWWGLFAFASLGLLLEALHGFKVGAYLDVDHEGRRLMWRLAHAHGALLSLVHLAFAWTLERATPRSSSSALLAAATLLVPGGFFLAGVDARGADPGLGVLLVPLGALLLLAALWQTARSVGRRTSGRG